MRKTLISLLFALFTVNSAQAAPPSDESIIQLIMLQEADKSPQQVIAQLDDMTEATVRQARQGKWFLSDAEQQAIKTFELKSQAVKAELLDRLDFEKLKPLYLKVYKEHFTQEEVDQLIALYQTPAGKLLVTRMPLVSQESSAVIEQSVTPVVGRMRQAAGEMKRQIDAANAPKP